MSANAYVDERETRKEKELGASSGAEHQHSSLCSMGPAMARAPVSLCQRNSSPHCLLQSRRSSGGRQRHQVSAEAFQDDGDTSSLLMHADDNRRAALLNLGFRKLSTCSAHYYRINF